MLERGRELGFLGPGSIDGHIDHALGYIAAIGIDWIGRAADLGSGGGVPGLVLALKFVESPWTFIEAQARRAQFLSDSVTQLGMKNRVVVVHDRAEAVGRSDRYRSGFNLVVARSFGSPAVTAECAAPLLEVDGRLVVSEPPSLALANARWPAEKLKSLGMRFERGIHGPPALAVLHATELCPERFPRRDGMPAKRPLW